MAHLTQPRFAPVLRNLTPPPQYALIWRATLSAAGLFAQLGATVPTRGFHLAYSPGFRGSIPPARPQRTDGTLRHASACDVHHTGPGAAGIPRHRDHAVSPV